MIDFAGSNEKGFFYLEYIGDKELKDLEKIVRCKNYPCKNIQPFKNMWEVVTKDKDFKLVKRFSCCSECAIKNAEEFNWPQLVAWVMEKDMQCT